MIVDQQDFNPLIGEVYHTHMLPPEQVKEINQLFDQRERMIVGIQWCEKRNVVKVLTGHFATITIPCSMFPTDKWGNKLEFQYPWLGDYGFDVFIGGVKIDLWTIIFT